MDKASAKKLACRFAVGELEQFRPPQYLSASDQRRVSLAMDALEDELRRRAGEFAFIPLAVPDDAMLAMISGQITIDGIENSVTINNLGESFSDTEKIANVLVELEEEYDFALVFKEVAHESNT